LELHQQGSRRRDLEPSTTSLQMRGCTLRAGRAPGMGIEPTTSFDHRLTVGHLAIRSTLECAGKGHVALPAFHRRTGEACPARRIATAAPKSWLGFQGARGPARDRRFWSGPGGDRTLAFRVRTGCSSLELQTHRRGGRVGRSGIEPDSFRLKSGCITTVASVPLFLFEPALRGPDLGFHRRPHFFVLRVTWWSRTTCRKATGLQPARASSAQNTPRGWCAERRYRPWSSMVISRRVLVRIPETPKAAPSLLRRPSVLVRA
jgi:hypothetical protein